MVLAVTGQFFLKKGVLSSDLAPNFSSIIDTLLNKFVVAGLLSYGISLIVWLFVLQRFPLSVAYPALSITYVVIVILSYFALHEPISQLKVAGVAFIIAGVFLLFE